MIATHWYKNFGSESDAWSRTARQGEMDFKDLTTAFPHPICILPGQSRDMEYTVRIGRPAVDGLGERALSRDSWQPSSPGTTIAARRRLDAGPQLNRARAHPLAHAAKNEGVIAERLVPGCRFRPEMVNCRRRPTARDLSLKKIEYGLMTDPGVPAPQAGE